MSDKMETNKKAIRQSLAQSKQIHEAIKKAFQRDITDAEIPTSIHPSQMSFDKEFFSSNGVKS